MRIAISVTAVLLLLTFAESLALVMLYEDMEEEFIASTLDEQLQYSIEHSRQVGSLIKPQTPDMTLYRHALGGPIPEGLPAALAGLPIGNHEDASTGRELHVAIREEDGFRYVLVFDETDHIDRETTVATAVAIGGMVMTVLSFILVYALAARLTRGLEALAARVRKLGGASATFVLYKPGNGQEGLIRSEARRLGIDAALEADEIAKAFAPHA